VHKTLINEIVWLQPPLDVERSMKKLPHANNGHCPSARLRVDGDSAASPDLASSKDDSMTIPQQRLQRMPWLASDFEQRFFEAFGREMRLGEREFFGMGIAQPARPLAPDCPNGVWRPHRLMNPDSGIDRGANKREED
jgi:hypothetical protein